MEDPRDQRTSPTGRETTVTFHEATSRLVLSSISIQDVAKETGVEARVIRGSGLDPSNPSYRIPPPNWRDVFITLARKRATDLLALVDELESDQRTLLAEPSAPEPLA